MYSEQLINMLGRGPWRKGVSFKTFFRLILLISIYTLSFYFIEWTEDRYNYEQLLTSIEDYSTDVFFTWLAKLAEKRNLSYDVIYHFHIVLQAIFFSLFSVKEFRRPLFPCIIAILLNFVNIANQMRFFAGFWAFLYGMTFYNKRRLLYYLFGIFACLNHITLIVMFLCMPFKKWLLKINVKQYIVIALSLLVLTPLIQYVLPDFLSSFSKYIASDHQSSFLGGVFNLFPTFVFVYLFFVKRGEFEKLGQSGDRLLETICIFSFLFIPLSVVFQLFSQRFVFPFISIWVAYLLENETIKRRKNFVRLLSVLTILWFYLAPLLLLGYSYYFDNVLVMLGYKPFLSI